MSVDPAAQAHALALCLAAGVGLGLFYDLLRLLRLAPAPRLLAGLLDLLFWLAAAGLLFSCALALGDGRVRLYMAAGLALGAALYFLLLSPPVRRVLAGLARLSGRILRLLTAPVRLLLRRCGVFCAQVKKSWKKHFHFSFPGSRIE
jgi:spore cortex biosynthesis protein YabQ